MMEFIWTKSSAFGSKVIRWGLDEPVSHFAIRCNKFIIESDFDGFSIESIYKFENSKRKIELTLKPKDISKEMEDIILTKLIELFRDQEYDFGAYGYFAYRAFLRKFFRIPLPKKNLWADNQKPLCTGVAEAIQIIKPEWFSEEIKEFDIVSPYSLYKNMKNSGHFIY